MKPLDFGTVYALAKTDPDRGTMEKTGRTGRMVVRKFPDWVGKPVEDVPPRRGGLEVGDGGQRSREDRAVQ